MVLIYEFPSIKSVSNLSLGNILRKKMSKERIERFEYIIFSMRLKAHPWTASRATKKVILLSTSTLLFIDSEFTKQLKFSHSKGSFRQSI